MIDHREEQIKLLAKQLKLPTFANYMDILRQAKADADFSDLLLDLLLAEAKAAMISSLPSTASRKNKKAKESSETPLPCKQIIAYSEAFVKKLLFKVRACWV